MEHRLPESEGSTATLASRPEHAVHAARAVVTPAVIARPATEQTTPVEFQYARFGARALAAFIDFIILNAVLSLINMVFMAVMFSGLNTTTILLSTIGPIVLGGALTLFYSVWLECSPWQATIGKKALGLKVVDLNGQRISFWRSSSRNFAKSFSALILGLGYLMPLWSAKRQTLHDRMARCVVIKATC